MSKPKLPSRPSEVWDCGFVSDEPRPVRWIEARNGAVLAGGDDLYLLKPGDEHWLMRPPPENIGPLDIVAIEPRGERRHALISGRTLGILFKGAQGEQVLAVRPQEEGPMWWITDIAWGGEKGACSLYVLRTDETLLRMRPDLSDLEELEVDAMSALASDDNGTVAMVSLDGAESRVYTTKDGVELSVRELTLDIDLDARVEIAVAGEAVALLIESKYVLLSRGPTDPFQRVEVLDSPEGSRWKTGPITFQGSSSDAALFCARWESDLVRIMRVDASGAATTIAELGGTEALDPPEVVSLTWDTARQTLWGASPYTGIIRCVAPEAKGKKKPVLS